MSTTKKWLRFIALQWFSFEGLFKDKKVDIVYPEGFKPTHEIDVEQGIVIFFPPDHRYIEASGDQGAGKTSWLNMCKEAAGSLSLTKYVNRITNDKKYEEDFEGTDGRLYRVKVTKSEFNLFEVKRDENGDIMLDSRQKPILAKQPSPKELVKLLVGPAGISPLEVAAKSKQDQIAWFRSVMQLTKDQLATEQALALNIDTTYKTRTKKNARTGELEKTLNNNLYYKEREKYLDYFTPEKEAEFSNLDVKVKEIQTTYNVYVGKQRDSVSLYEDKVKKAKEIEETQDELKRLQQKLQMHQADYEAIDREITTIDLYLLENKQVVIDYNEITGKITEATEFKAKKQEYEAMVAMLSEYKEVSTEAVELTKKLTDLRLLKQKFNAQIAPTVPGLEIVTPDAEDPREGAFFNGAPIDTLCESENWEWYIPFARECKIRVMYVEGISNLGTGSIQKFNEFIEQGGYVFAAKMDREQPNLRITFNNKIPLKQ